MSAQDWWNDFKRNKLVKAVGTLANDASYVPLPENPEFDARTGIEAADLLAQAASHINEGIYEVTTASGMKYIGQSGDIDRRLAEHVAAQRFSAAEAAAAKRTQVLGGKTAREIQEQMRITDLKGPNGGKLLNKINPIGKRRNYLLPQKYWR